MKYFTIILTVLLVISLIVPLTHTIRILAVETVGGKSHWNFMRAVLKALVERGHEVTVFTPFLDGNRPNYTEIDISHIIPIKMGMGMIETILTWQNPRKLLKLMTQMGRMYCDLILYHDKLQDILQNSSHLKYDIVLIEPVSTGCQSLIATKLNLPMIYIIPSPSATLLERTITGQVLNPAHVSHMLYSHAYITKSFNRRFDNLMLYFYGALRTQYNEIYLKYTSPKSYDKVESVTPSLIFENTYYITEPHRPFMPSVIQIGGIHLGMQAGIPNDILDFIESSPYGVIYFTFGSVVTMSTLPKDILNSFKDALAKVPQRILWKFEGEMDDKPANVMIKKWFPQRDILLHPKIKLFISHGGISGVYEAVDAGVPVLGFPLFFDQPRNIDNLVENGMALSLNLLTVTKEPFYQAVMELINNKKYTKNAKIASARFKDRPMTPAESVVYWTEYVVRHKGAQHLKSHALNLTWYQYFLLDILSVIILILFIIFYTIYILYVFAKSVVFRNLKTVKQKNE